ncbi:hypothetical protein ACSDQ9_02270 [Aestuariimicrobium soli]|uniref:hypothetical protein n=1 Tax=Aestuariimicrobium soli TaxID=2035834 RepID=UPI003EB9A241
MRIFTNLNLNGTSPARVQPKVGEWGPRKVPTTAAKKRMRIWVSIAFVVVATVLVYVGYTFFKAFTQSQGG